MVFGYVLRMKRRVLGPSLASPGPPALFLWCIPFTKQQFGLLIYLQVVRGSWCIGQTTNFQRPVSYNRMQFLILWSEFLIAGYIALCFLIVERGAILKRSQVTHIAPNSIFLHDYKVNKFPFSKHTNFFKKTPFGKFLFHLFQSDLHPSPHCGVLVTPGSSLKSASMTVSTCSVWPPGL